MASPMQDGVGRYRPLEGKSSKSPKSKNISSRHRGRTPSDTFRKSEQSLRELLEDFESGRLNAFGKNPQCRPQSILHWDVYVLKVRGLG